MNTRRVVPHYLPNFRRNYHEFEFTLDDEKQGSERRASLENADAEPYRSCQAQAVGMITLGVGMGGLEGEMLSPPEADQPLAEAGAGRLALRPIFDCIC